MATIYICKCGRRASKSTNADTTGNRDTENCKGCPYLLPYGADRYVEGQGFVRDILGYECRMTKDIEYATRFCGQIDDKRSCYIASLDFDFLTRVSNWIGVNYPDRELIGSFSMDDIRSVEYSSNGRYRMSIGCAQNKKGIAAKAALLHQFFDASGARLDKTPEEEKAIVLAAIEAGKAQAQKKEDKTLMYKDPVTGWLYRVSPNPINDKGLYELEYLDQQNSTIWKPDVYWNTNAVYRDQEHLQEALDDRARRDGWELVEDVPAENPTDAAPASPVDAGAATQSLSDAGPVSLAADLPDVCQSCQCVTCGNEDCPTPCFQRDDEVQECKKLGPMGDACEYYQPKEDAQCQKENAPSADTAATSDGSAARMCEDPDEETRTTPAAASGAALESLHAQAVLPQNAPAQDIAADAPSAQAFDYSGLDAVAVDTLHVAERIIRTARQKYIVDMAGAVSMVHGELVRNSDEHNNQHTEDTFIAWCRFMGISKTTAYQLLQVQSLISGATAEEQATLEAASPSLLYAAAKPSAPAELVQAVKDGDITTHKQYQEALAEIKARDAKIQELLEMSENSDRRADEAEDKAKKAEQERDAARDAQVASSHMANMIANQRDEAQIRAEKAELRAKAAEEDAAEKDKRIRELETIRPQTIEATVVERIRMPEMAEEDAAELTTNLAASVTTVQRSFFMAAAAMAPQVKARCANTLWDTVNELATLLAASANPSYEEEEATPFD